VQKSILTWGVEMMRWGLLFAVMGFSLVAVNAGAADAISGTVVSLERDTGMIVILQTGTRKRITISISPGRLPGSVKIGTTIQAWGEVAKNDPLKFQASKIEPSPGSAGDPTGVRSRLQKGK